MITQKCKNPTYLVAGGNGVPAPTVKQNQADVEFLTIPEAAAFLRISISKLQKMIAQREISFCQPKAKGKITIPKSVLIDYQYAGLVPTAASVATSAVTRFLHVHNQKGAA
ncbi:MAG: helix-turn-helix domain-containing protein [Bacteroidetes bacterium]|uniref:helix-turn-helix domain-containing protein n=1 Tax=Phnomibacter sp. TaxID=2836217 RepID=UPI002FDE0B70|nr:helix-turn-helix domain-containing protein [Bacteroidota bacterium]